MKNYKLIIYILIFSIISIASIYSSTFILSSNYKYIYLKQIIWYLVGFIILYFLTKIKKNSFYKYSFILYVIFNILLILVLFFGDKINGSKAWFNIPKLGAFQPSEFMKIILAEKDILSGKVKARNLSQKQKAIFLDRDGTINKYVGFLTKPEEFDLLPGVAEAIRQINHSGYLCIVVSNQPVIARGDCTFEQLQEIHDKMETLLGQEGAFVDAIYYCPHHPDKGFEGERPAYKIDCNCRKPKPGLLLQAAKDWNIDLSQSYMIGDSDRDVEAGNAAGCKQSFFIKTNEPDALLSIVNKII